MLKLDGPLAFVPGHGEEAFCRAEKEASRERGEERRTRLRISCELLGLPVAEVVAEPFRDKN